MKSKILIVDDDIELAHEVANLLKDEDYSVQISNTIIDASANLKEFKPEIVLLDLKLPDGTGLDLLKKIKSESSETFVIMLSGYGTISKAVEAMKQGAEDFLTKPLDPEHLILVLDKMFKHEQLRHHALILEQKVAERTRDLIKKNKELENALDQLKRMQHQLIMSEKMASLGSLVAGITHEINTPIGAVNSATNVSSRCIKKIRDFMEENNRIDDINESSDFQKTLDHLQNNNQIINTAGVRIAGIVRNLKNFARLDEEELQSTNIHKDIESSLSLVRHELEDKIEVVREYGEITPIKCYPNQLNQVFMNLLINAANAIEGKGKIKIKTFADNKNIHINISDNGKGISPENINKIFNPGFTTKGVGVGTGLGLSICYNIVKEHQGSIDVESTVSKGTSFTITLPITR